MTKEEQIIECEKRLLQAVKSSEIDTLEELLDDNLIFNIPSGLTINKRKDIENYRLGLISVKNIEIEEQIISCIDETVIVSVVLKLKANYSDQNIDGMYRYLRVWKLSKNIWKVIAGSAIRIQ